MDNWFNFASGDMLSAFLYGGDVLVDIHTPVELVYKSGPRKGQSYIQNKFVDIGTDEIKINTKTWLSQLYILKITGTDNKLLSEQKIIKL